MMLTPLPRHRLAWALAAFAAGLDRPEARRVFRRIAVPAQAARARGAAAATHWRQALALARRFGIGLRPGSPQRASAGTGARLRTATEAYVLLHEIAHFQLARPERRRQVDFGLGPGPETGDRAAPSGAPRCSGSRASARRRWPRCWASCGRSSWGSRRWPRSSIRTGSKAPAGPARPAFRRDLESAPHGRLRHRHGSSDARLAPSIRSETSLDEIVVMTTL